MSSNNRPTHGNDSNYKDTHSNVNDMNNIRNNIKMKPEIGGAYGNVVNVNKPVFKIKQDVITNKKQEDNNSSRK